MKPLLFVEGLLDHPMLYPVLVILLGAMSPQLCAINIHKVEKVMNNFVVNLTILIIILLTSMVDMSLALLWTFTYLMLWMWIWTAIYKKDMETFLMATSK